MVLHVLCEVGHIMLWTRASIRQLQPHHSGDNHDKPEPFNERQRLPQKHAPQQGCTHSTNSRPHGIPHAVWELGYEDAQAIIARLREEFPDDALLGVENGDGLQSVVATIYQSFAGQDLYPTLEEKAANLLYLVVKDHPLADGNKRSAAALFVEFLDRNAALYQADGAARVSNNALAAMTLMVAMSSPQEKDLMVALIQRMIGAA